MSDVNFNQLPNGWAKQWTKEEDELLIENYTSKTIEELLTLLPRRSKQSIYGRAHKLGLKYHTYNENYFNTIDSPTKAYWLGFLYTDGYVTTKYRWGVELSQKDISHLELLNKDLESNVTIRTRTRKSDRLKKIVDGYTIKDEYNSCSLSLKNKQMYESLVSKGVVPKKTQSLKFPTTEQVPKEFIPDFIRGLFDGDGSYSISKNGKYKKYCVGMVCASQEFLIDLQKVLDENNIKLNLHKTRNNLWVLRSEKKQTIVDFFKYVYYDEDCRSLQRKKEKSIEMLRYCLPQ